MKRALTARALTGLGLLGLCGSLCGCLVMGYSSGGGFWILPGSLILTAVLVLWFLLGRR